MDNTELKKLVKAYNGYALQPIGAGYYIEPATENVYKLEGGNYYPVIDHE